MLVEQGEVRGVVPDLTSMRRDYVDAEDRLFLVHRGDRTLKTTTDRGPRVVVHRDPR
jgi:hypothetical protein